MTAYQEDEKDRGLKGPLTARHPIRRLVAVAIEAGETTDAAKDGSLAPDRAAQAKITAAGRGKLAEQILEMAFARGIKVREDADLAELLAQMELDSPVPSEAVIAVAEILAKVYEANNDMDRSYGTASESSCGPASHNSLCNLAQNDPFSDTLDSSRPPKTYKAAGE